MSVSDEYYPRRKRRDTTPKTTITIRLPVPVMNYFRAQVLSLPPSKRPSLASLIQNCVLAHLQGKIKNE